jgi:SAM-dependent methyltransferase
MDALLEATYRAEQHHFWFHGFRRFVRPLLRRAAAGRTHLRILDCGCGTGANLGILDDFGPSVGVDITWTGLALARGQYDRRVACANVVQLPFANEQFDLVTSFDVLYCLEEPDERAAVAEMWRVLRPRGALVVNVAALRVLHGHHSLLSNEKRRYHRPELRRLLERGGFRIERLTYTNASLFPMMAASRLLQRFLPIAPSKRVSREMSIPPAPINHTLAAMLAVESRLLRLMDMPFGSSLLALAWKD